MVPAPHKLTRQPRRQPCCTWNIRERHKGAGRESGICCATLHSRRLQLRGCGRTTPWLAMQGASRQVRLSVHGHWFYLLFCSDGIQFSPLIQRQAQQNGNFFSPGTKRCHCHFRCRKQTFLMTERTHRAGRVACEHLLSGSPRSPILAICTDNSPLLALSTNAWQPSVFFLMPVRLETGPKRRVASVRRDVHRKRKSSSSCLQVRHGQAGSKVPTLTPDSQICGTLSLWAIASPPGHASFRGGFLSKR